jgi:hypothetical protein
MRNYHQLGIWLMWLAVPVTALDYWRAWDQLPAEMAVHFDFHWRANGWASREAALGLGVGLVTFMLLVFTISSYVVRISPIPKFMPWVLLMFFYATIAFVCAVDHWIVRYNLNERMSGVCCAREYRIGILSKVRTSEGKANIRAEG